MMNLLNKLTTNKQKVEFTIFNKLSTIEIDWID